MQQYAKFIPMLALALVLSGGAAHAQTTGTTTTGTGTTGGTEVTTPGSPNTGAGGTASENFVTLAAMTAVIAAGGVYLMRTRRS